MATGFDQDDRLQPGGGFQATQKPPGIANTFHVQQYAGGLAVHGQIIQDFSKIDIRRGAGRDHRGETDILRLGPIENCRADGAGLGNQRQVSFLDLAVAESGIESTAGAYHSQTIGADDADIIAMGNVQYFLLQAPAGLAQFAEAGADDDGAHPFFTALPHDSGNGWRGRGNHHQIQRVGYGVDIRIGLEAEQFVVLVVYRV